jgi:DNA (cytosine-5)-methyltransferase 1
MKFFSLFSGIGAPEKALDNIGIPYELVAFCENDKYAAKSYAAIHGVPESMNIGDITKVDEKKLPKDIDILAYGFPCQDISNAGKMKGLFNADGTQTRSGLFFDALRIIKETQPKVAIAENVKMLTSKKFAIQFKIVLDSLKAAGYNNYWKVVNAKDCGIPQNRERVFIVSIRMDVDPGSFAFPLSIPLEQRLKDVLEDEVEEKYFIKTGLTRKLVINSDLTEPQVLRLVRSEHGKVIRKKYESGEVVEPWSEMKQYEPRTDGVSNTVSTVLKDNILLIREATKLGYAEATVGDSINFEHPNSKTRRGMVGKQVSQTLTTSPQQGVVTEDLRIRYFTPKECFRLMGFEDSDFEKAEAVNSNSQLYKQAGNSIVVPVVQSIIQGLLDCGALEGVMA